jgi:ABC-type thiamine transport system ATPase subunit
VKIRKQKFSPMLLDEADGALSPRLRAGYVEMIEHARTEAGLRNVIVVSHDVGVQEAISQRILMSELAKQEAVA